MIHRTGNLAAVTIEPTITRRHPKSWPHASTFVVSMLLVLAIAIVLPEQMFGFIHMGGQECSKPDLITGFTHLKNKSITWTQEGFSSGSTNSIGFLDYEHKLVKRPGVCRIAMLGDSMTESLQVPQECRFSNLLEHRLNELYPGRFEVFNFGISAAGSGQELLTYLRYVEQYKPDVTILFFDCGDEDKDGRKPFMAPWHPHVVFGLQNADLTVSWRDFDSWNHSAQAIPIALFESIRARSHLWGVLIQRFNELKSDASFQGACAYLDRLHMLEPIEDSLTSFLPVSRFGPTEFKAPQSEIYAERAAFCSKFGLVCADSAGTPIARFNQADFEFGSEPEFHTRHLTAEQQAGLARRDRERWQLTKAILKRFAFECKRQDSAFVVVGLPVLHGKEAFDSAFRQVISLADGQNSYAVNLTSLFDAAARTKQAPPRIVSHLSTTGHQVMADLLFNYLMQQGLLKAWTQAQSN